MRRRDPLALDLLDGRRPDRRGRWANGRGHQADGRGHQADGRGRRVLAGVAAGVLAGAMLLGGCQPADDVTTPPPISPILPTEQTTPTGSPSISMPSTSASPSASLVVTARPTTPEETAALAAEAEHVYREMRRLMDEYESQGGAATLPEPLKAYVGGKYAGAVESSLQYTHSAKSSFQGSTIVHAGAVFLSDLNAASLIGITFCNDRGCQMVCVRGSGDLKEIDYDHDQEAGVVHRGQ